MSQYTIKVRGQRVEVNEEVYKAYYKFREHEVYLRKLAMKHEVLISFNVDTDEGLNVELELFDSVQELPDEQAIRNIMTDLIKQSIPKLNAEQQQIIDLYYFKNCTIREAANLLRMQSSTFQYKLKKTIDELRKLIDW